ncbi:hypothetical protein ROZALSC1DRAFT_30796 [Rozella allomycis CSF55]|uniref:Metallothionein n=1 Tax=Rozella allomycis (strain CSF55) TaxID=988480 RepID=A0A075AQM3_ROZAC|nr:hypothetical protein O9G_005069 [Rozella allomycis CSF55]RKP17391.1 hypothetical protein ROZALSC1DRAFT_30796 [Rozella allomycis CSF55]|eukprot:EPZ32470.1 hypothetical protein O9G_005069 [Rozella allomycis CSF55]
MDQTKSCCADSDCCKTGCNCTDGECGKGGCQCSEKKCGNAWCCKKIFHTCIGHCVTPFVMGCLAGAAFVFLYKEKCKN